MKQIVLLFLPLLALANIQTQNERLFRTLNLGNYLEAPEEGNWTNGDTITEADIIRIADKGFTAVRLPARWSNHLLEDNQIDPAFLTRVTTIIDWAVENELTVVLDVHHFEEIMEDTESNTPVLKSIWEQLSDHYKSYSDSVLFFEPLNEPHTNLTAEKWNTLFADIVNVIRTDNPTRPIVMGTTNWGGISGLNAVTLPDDDNIIVTVHYYQPFTFTHQGASWSSGADAWLGTTWEGDYFQKEAIRKDIDAVVKWRDDNDVPVFVGEFGAYDKADMDSRVLWTHFVSRLFESRDLPWAYWEYSQGFGLYNLQNEQWHQNLTDTILSEDTSTLDYSKGCLNLGDEVLENGDFSEGTSKWFHNQGSGTSSLETTDSETLLHTLTELPDQSYHVQLIQSGVNLKDETTYLFTVELRSDDAITSDLFLMRPNDGYSQVASGGSQEIALEGTTLELVFTTSQEESDISAVLSLGHSIGTVEIVKASLKEIVNEEVDIESARTAVQASLVSVSIVNNAIELSKELQPNNEIRIYSVRGQLLFSASDLTDKRITIPNELSPGWYGVSITENRKKIANLSSIVK